jgi:hypothetical protein
MYMIVRSSCGYTRSHGASFRRLRAPEESTDLSFDDSMFWRVVLRPII